MKNFNLRSLWCWLDVEKNCTLNNNYY